MLVLGGPVLVLVPVQMQSWDRTLKHYSERAGARTILTKPQICQSLYRPQPPNFSHKPQTIILFVISHGALAVKAA
jgi:hypothetical protein